MIVSEPGVERPTCWQLQALPGDGLIATASHHLLVVEVDDDIAARGIADEVVTTFDAHSRLRGRAASRSLCLAISSILADHDATTCAVALVSAWDDALAVYLHGHAEALLVAGARQTSLSGLRALVATDVVVPNDVDELVLHVGPRPPDDPAPLDVGAVTAGRGVRARAAADGRRRGPLNTWNVPR